MSHVVCEELNILHRNVTHSTFDIELILSRPFVDSAGTVDILQNIIKIGFLPPPPPSTSVTVSDPQRSVTDTFSVCVQRCGVQLTQKYDK